jgi:hypothetical protein
LDELKKWKPTFPELRDQDALPFLVEKVGWMAADATQMQMALVIMGSIGDARAFDILAEAVRG